MPYPLIRYLALTAIIGCATAQHTPTVPKPKIIPHSEWQTTPPLGYAANATRRNKKAGDFLSFENLRINILNVSVDSTREKPVDIVRLGMVLNDKNEERIAREG